MTVGPVILFPVNFKTCILQEREIGLLICLYYDAGVFRNIWLFVKRNQNSPGQI